MAEKTKTREITIVDKSGRFNTFFKKLSLSAEEEFDLEGLSALRRLLSDEKAKLLYTIKSKSPNSIYQLAKLLQRDFKSVSQDIKLLERFGFIELVKEKTKNRIRHKPIIAVDNVLINLKI